MKKRSVIFAVSLAVAIYCILYIMGNNPRSAAVPAPSANIGKPAIRVFLSVSDEKIKPGSGLYRLEMGESLAIVTDRALNKCLVYPKPEEAGYAQMVEVDDLSAGAIITPNFSSPGIWCVYLEFKDGSEPVLLRFKVEPQKNPTEDTQVSFDYKARARPPGERECVLLHP